MKFFWFILIGISFILGCQKDGQQQSQSGEGQLSAFEQENGIGPIKEKIVFGALDQAMADNGRKIFESKCASCHKMDQRFVGPPLGQVMQKRTPAYIMNMMLNPQEMIQKHPEANKIFKEFLVPMTFQNVTTDDARAIVEFLRNPTPLDSLSQPQPASVDSQAAVQPAPTATGK